MTMKVLFYGRLGETIGREAEVEWTAGLRTLADLRQALAQRFPHASAELLGPRVRACLGDQIVADDAALSEDSEVAFFPPLSGG